MFEITGLVLLTICVAGIWLCVRSLRRIRVGVLCDVANDPAKHMAWQNVKRILKIK